MKFSLLKLIFKYILNTLRWSAAGNSLHINVDCYSFPTQNSHCITKNQEHMRSNSVSDIQQIPRSLVTDKQWDKTPQNTQYKWLIQNNTALTFDLLYLYHKAAKKMFNNCQWIVIQLCCFNILFLNSVSAFNWSKHVYYLPHSI